MRFQLQDHLSTNRIYLPWMLLLLITMASLLTGCGTVPDARDLIHDKALYRDNSRFTGPRGPLTEAQGHQIIARLKEHQQTPSDILARHLAFEQAVSDVPLVVGNKATLLENSSATYNAMLAAIRSANDNINIEMYTFSSGAIGQMFADALIERQRHGVQVNFAYDSLGSLGTPASFFDRLRENGIAVMQYRPLNPFAAKLSWTLSHRNHRKMLIVDGRVAFTGGINISEVYASGLGSREKSTPQASWRDTDVELQGPAVAEIQKLFINEWYYQGGTELSPRDYFPVLERQGNEIVRVIASVPEQFSLIYVTLISAVVNSESYVYITDAYFAPDHQMLHALEHAADRGVDVRLLLPSQSDEPFIVSAERSHYEALLDSGVKIYEWKGAMLHAKTATVDGVWSTVGTSNLDWWSIARNNEVNAIVLSHSFGEQMDLMFEADMKNAKRIELDQWNQRGMRERLYETGARIVEPLL